MRSILTDRLRFLERRVPPPIVALTIALAMWAGIRFVAAPPSPDHIRQGIALAFVLLGVLLTANGFRAFFRARTTINPVHVERASALVTTGIYGVTRNPMYLGLASVLVGWTIYLATPWLAVGPAGFVAYITQWQILPEERFLRSKFGAEFDGYCARVRRWI